MKGRKPKPNAIRKLQGNPGRTPLPKEVLMPGGVPPCPTHLTGEAAIEWKRITTEAAAANLLHLCDRAALAVYCQLWKRWVELEEDIANNGMTYDANGLMKANPAVRISHDTMALMKSYLVEFGFTPASRSKVSAGEPAKPADPMEEFLGGTGFAIAPDSSLQ